jgi:hypothetical protein
MFNAGSARVAAAPPRSVPPFIWAAALQVYWLLHGIWGMASGGVVLGIGLGIMGAAGGMRNGFPGAGSEGERILIAIAVSFLAGAFDACVSIVLVHGLLTLKTWAYGVFMIWLPVKVVLWVVTFALSMSMTMAMTPMTTEQRPSQPVLVTIIVVLGVVLQFGALLAGFLLVRRGRTALAQAGSTLL